MKLTESDRVSQLLLKTLKTERVLVQLANSSTETDIKAADDALLASFENLVECLSAQSIRIETSVAESIFRCAIRFLTRPSTTMKLFHLAIRCLRSCKKRSVEALSSQNAVIVLGHLAGQLEQLKSPSYSGLDNLTEEIASETFGCILDITYEQQYGLEVETKDVITAFLPQLIHSALTFTSHSSKTLSLISIQSLSSILIIFGSFEEIWTSSFPGIFSAVFKVVQHGNNRQSRFLLENCTFLLRCFALVCKPFMRLINESEEGKEMWKEQLLGLSSATATSSSTSGVSLWKWRVDLLQHIHIPFPTLLRSTISSLSTEQSRESLKHEIIEFILSSAEFLGVDLSGEVISIIANIDDTSEDMMTRMKDKGLFFHRLQQTFHDHLSSSFHRLTTSSSLNNISPDSTQMTQRLTQILGFWGYLQAMDRKAWVVLHREMIVSTLVKLSMPPVEAVVAMMGGKGGRVVEMIRCVDTLHHSRSSVVDVSFFDAIWPTINNNKECLRLLNILCIEFASEEGYGLRSEIVLRGQDLLRRLSDKLLQTKAKKKKPKKNKIQPEEEKEEQIGTDSFRKKKQKILTLAAFLRLQTLFSCHQVNTLCRPPLNAAVAINACVVCAVSAVALSRCGRCRQVWYCSREHQLQHWPTHRFVCSKPATDDKPKESKKERKVTKDLLSLRTNADILLAHINDVDDDNRALSSREMENRLESIINLLSRSLDLYLYLVVDSNSNSKKSVVLAPSLEQLTLVALNAIADTPLLFGDDLITKNGLFLQQLLFKVLAIMFASASEVMAAVASTALTRLALTLHPTSVPHFIRYNLDYIVDSACAYFKSRVLTSPECIYAALAGILKMLSAANIADEQAVRLLRDAAFDGLDLLDESLTLGMYTEDALTDKGESGEEADSDDKHSAAIAAVKMLAALPLVDPLSYASLASLLLHKEKKESGDGLDVVKVWLTDAESSHLQSEIASRPEQQSHRTNEEDVSDEMGRAMLQSLIDFDLSLFAMSAVHHADTSDTPDSPDNIQQEKYTSTSNRVSRQLLIELLPRLALQLTRPARTVTLITLDGLAAILLRLHLPFASEESNESQKESGEEMNDILPQALHMVWEALLPRLTQLCSLYNKRILTKAVDTVTLSGGTTGVKQRQKVVTRQRLEIGEKEGDAQKDALVLKLLHETTATSPSSVTVLHSKPLRITHINNNIQPPAGQQLKQQRVLFVLPRLWEFISLLALLRPSFLQHKLLEDLWPLLLRSLQAVALTLSLSAGSAKSSSNSLDQQLALALLAITRRLAVIELCPDRAVSVIALLLQPMLAQSVQDEIRWQAQKLMKELVARDPTLALAATPKSDSGKMHKALAAAYDLLQLQPRVQVPTTFSQPRYANEGQEDKLRQQLEVRQHAIMQRDVQTSLLCLNSSGRGQLMIEAGGHGREKDAVDAVDGRWINEQLKRWSMT